MKVTYEDNSHNSVTMLENACHSFKTIIKHMRRYGEDNKDQRTPSPTINSIEISIRMAKRFFQVKLVWNDWFSPQLISGSSCSCISVTLL